MLTLDPPWAWEKLEPSWRREWQTRRIGIDQGASCVALYAEARGIARVYSDKLSFPFTDTGKGWLIFDMPEADLGCHSSDRVYHSISFYCDDIKKNG
jgi:hypothetical protein